MSHQTASDCLLWCSAHCPRHVVGSCQNPSPPRPSYHQHPAKASVLPKTDKLPTTFISSLSTKTMFLHEQLAEWDWNPSTDAVFQHLKAWICQTLLNATLAYYDRSKPVIVQTDASKYGFGATLIENGHPVDFTSKSLTDVETCYTNI